MKLNYYVLWVENNIMLDIYLNRYYDKLLIFIKDLSNIWILNKEFINLINNPNNKSFILNPDNSSIINLLYKELFQKVPQNIGNIEFFIDKLSNEINIFLTEWINSWNLSMNKWNFISWTNIKLTTNDNNPYNNFDAHPDHKNTWWVLWWGLKTESEWIDIYNKTFELLKTIDLGFYYELNKIINKVIPLWTAFSIHNSASYKEAIWHIYLWYTIDSDSPEINNLEAIIHESSHNKLNLIMQFDPIILNTREEKYYSAIRPDSRHIHWVFIGYHAFAPTMYILMKAYKDWYFWDNNYWLEKIVLYHIKTKFLQKVIKKYAKLTKLWIEISEEIDYVISLMDKILKELNPSKDIINIAREKQIEHFKSVNLKYPNLEY